MTSRSFTTKTTGTKDTSIPSIIDLQDVDLEEGDAAKTPKRTASERLKELDRKTFAFAGYIFWAMLIVVGAATVGILVTQKNTTNSPTQTPDSGLGMAIVQGFESKLGDYVVESALKELAFDNTDVLDGILELGRRIQTPPAILAEQSHLEAMQIATEINNKAFSLRTTSGNDISSTAASTLQSDLTTLRDRLYLALNGLDNSLFESLTAEQWKDVETYRNYFVNVYAQSVAAYEGLAKKLEVQRERDCSLEPPPTPAPIYVGPSGNHVCRGGYNHEGSQIDPLRGDYFVIAGGITSLSACEKACDARYDCLGIGFGNYGGYRCELWRKEIVTIVPSSFDFQCKRQVIPPPTPQEPCKWYHISSDALNEFFIETKESVEAMYIPYV